MRHIAFLIAVAVAFPAVASIQPATSRGFTTDGAYHVNGIDAVNGLTGNLEVVIPIGPAFKTNGTLTYSFTLRYHGNLWDLIEYPGTDGWPAGGVPTHWSRNPPMDAFPSRDFNAGLGWRLTDGSYLKNHPLTSEDRRYVDETGADHRTFPTPAGGSTSTGKTFTIDMTYRRITASAGSNYVTVEHPDGIRERLVCHRACGTNADEWGLDQKSDPFGNVLYVTRTTSGSTETWTYTEAVGTGPYPDHLQSTLTTVRTHKVLYTDQRVSQVKLSSAGPGHEAVYTFGYNTFGILRPYLLNGLPQPTVPFGVSHGQNRMSLALLTGITMPANEDGSSPGDWAFSYIIDPSPADYPGDVRSFQTPDHNYSWDASHYGGLLEQITLPTRGKLRYKYEVRNISRSYCTAPPEVMHQGFASIAVRERAILKANGDLDGPRPWRYFGRMFTVENPQGPQRELVSGVLDPLGNMEVSYFAVFIGDCVGQLPAPDGYNKYEWGMNLSKEEKDSAGRYLQSRVFQCTNLSQFDVRPTEPNPFDPGTGYRAFRRLHTRYHYSFEPPDGLSCGAPVRTTYAQWENDGGYCRGDYNTDCDQFNRRVKSTSTVYHDDQNSFTEVVNDHYDGFGHYRTMRSGGNFFARNYPQLSGGDERIEFIGYNPGVVFQNGTYTSLPGSATLATMPWILDTYDLEKISQARNGQAGGANPLVSSTLFLFNATTGFLERQRTLRRSVDCTWNAATAKAACYTPAFLDAADLMTVQSRSSSGTTTTVTSAFHGGDKNGSLPTSGDLTTALGVADYVIKNQYQYGGLLSSGYYDCGGGEPLFFVEQNQVDPYSGLVVSSKDSAGAETLYAYDHLGRYRKIDPPGGEVPTTYTYIAASGSEPPRIEVTTGSSPASVLRTMIYGLDHLGRLALEKEQVPSETGGLLDSVRTTEYHANGWTISQSTMGPASAQGKVLYQDYDAFGRAKTVLHADHGTGGERRTTYQYFGIREMLETVHGIAGQSTSAATTRGYDRFGNLVKVSQPAGANGADARTRYEYDNLDNLTFVDGPGQTRTFAYDMRGLLLSETHPELAGRSIRYSAYDARGNPGQKALAGASEPATPFDVRMRYDGAERLIRVTQIGGPPCPSDQPNCKLLKTFNYFPQTGGGIPALSAGKLKRSIRYNRVPPATAPAGQRIQTPVTLDYAYNATTGRLASRTLTVADLALTTGYTHDVLGNVATIVYPRLSGCSGCTTTIGPARTVSYGYQQGRLASVSSFASRIAYAANGTVRKVVHTNGTVDRFEPDTDYLPRPSSIRTEFVGHAAWNAGPYTYDARGSVSSIGAETYSYDRVNRLVHATLSGGNEAYEYDANGNLTKFIGRGVQQTVPLNASTNRLTAPNTQYDEAGNLTRWVDPRDGSDAVRDYDPFNLLTHNRGAGQGKIYLYDASDERVAVYDYGSGTALRQTWSVRGVGNMVLRDFTRVTPASGPAVWSWRDNIFRGTALLAQAFGAAASAGEVLHAHVDHLGSVRRLSNGAGAPVDNQEFFPFGEEVNPLPDENRFKFTGHERDSGTKLHGTLDSMHARYYVPTLGRFLSMDPGEPDWNDPQTWNRYAYVRNNPVSRIDPDGRVDQTPNEATDPGWVDWGNQCISPEEAERQLEERIELWEREQKALENERQFQQDVVNGLVETPLFVPDPPHGTIGPAPPERPDDHHGSHAHGGSHDHPPHLPEKEGSGGMRGSGDRETWHEHQKLREEAQRRAEDTARFRRNLEKINGTGGGRASRRGRR
ncbi:MAG TPA: RHS repeat-associated core domain-containing protein [Thermoanaerobaculia bacterium]|nr:RHS repeat-associated core domain-containing protein [Thermoanaerobaculia bacterium]